LADVLRDALAPLGKSIDLAFVFGSVAQGKERSAAMWMCSWSATRLLPMW